MFVAFVHSWFVLSAPTRCWRNDWSVFRKKELLNTSTSSRDLFWAFDGFKSASQRSLGDTGVCVALIIRSKAANHCLITLMHSITPPDRLRGETDELQVSSNDRLPISTPEMFHQPKSNSLARLALSR